MKIAPGAYPKTTGADLAFACMIASLIIAFLVFVSMRITDVEDDRHMKATCSAKGGTVMIIDGVPICGRVSKL